MANTQSMTTSFMGELLTATHNFGTAPTRETLLKRLCIWHLLLTTHLLRHIRQLEKSLVLGTPQEA